MHCIKMFRSILFTILPGLLVFCSCADKISGTVDDTDTGICVYLPDNTPAIDAIIKFIPSTRSQTTGLPKKGSASSAVAVVRTDASGKFKVPVLADSTYNIFMEKGDLKAFQGEVVITSQGHSIQDDTLSKTGSFTAFIGLDPKDMHNVGSVAIQILGSDVQFTNPDKNGSFTFKDIAAGSYKLRLETNLPEYSPTFFTMPIQSGIDSIYPDTITIEYTGIHSVTGLSAVFDTSNGVVRLSWSSTKYSNILDYVVFRDAEPTVTYSAIPYKATTDTTLLDTIYDIKNTPIDTQTLSYKYRVAIRNNSTDIGNTYGAISVTATPYQSFIPKVTNPAISFDTLHGVAYVSWDSIPAASGVSGYRVIRTVAPLMEPAKTDTLLFSASHAFIDTIFPKLISFEEINPVEITYTISALHSIWNVYGIESAVSDTVYSFKAFPPLISAGMNQTVDISSDVLLVGSVTAATFPVVKKEWKVGDSEWVAGVDSIHFKTNSEHTRETISCFFRVTDSVGNVTIDTMVVTKTPLMVTLSKFPSQIQGTTVVIPLLNKIDSQNDYLYLGYIDIGKYGIWSTSDFNNYSVESANTGITDTGSFFTFKNNYYVYNIPSLNSSCKSFKSSDGISWAEIQPVINQGDSYAYPWDIKFLPRKDDILLVTSKFIEVANYKATYENILYKTNDGLNWDSISNALPQERLADLLTIGNSLCLITSYNKYISSDEGITWSVNNFWDTDGDLFPDDFYSSASSDSLTLVAYLEKPSLTEKIAMYKNGVWTNIPIELLNISTISPHYFAMKVIENKCLVYERSRTDAFYTFDETVRSFKLY